MTEDIGKRRWGAILSSVPTTQPTGNVQAFKRWDKMEEAIKRCRNYLVQAEAEEHKCEIALDEARKAKEEAIGLLRQAEDEWRAQSRTLLGVVIDAPEDEA